jgi:penicillin amidase
MPRGITADDLRLATRRFSGHAVDAEPHVDPQPPERKPAREHRHLLQSTWFLIGVLVVLLGVGALVSRIWVRHAMREALPQIDGTLRVDGLSAPVSVKRDVHGVPHIRAASMGDLVFAQGFVTAQDRLWQMDTLRRHAAGRMAEVLGTSMIEHDLTQRTLRLSAAADAGIAAMPADELHILEVYARGVNASIAQQQAHLPIEFRLLHYAPAPWTPRDSLLVDLSMFQELTNTFPIKVGREAIASKLPAQMVDDLYPVGSWRDHPPTVPATDLTRPAQEAPDVPLDNSQVRLRTPAKDDRSAALVASLDALRSSLSLGAPACTDGCRAGSNEWAISGERTASGLPLLANDMHLNLSLPDIWYEADLEAPEQKPSAADEANEAVTHGRTNRRRRAAEHAAKNAAEPRETAQTNFGGAFHVAGVSLPGVPMILVGHNAHIAWGFTNLGADVQDLTIEELRGSGAQQQFHAADGSWQLVQHHPETIVVRGGQDLKIDVRTTRHGNMETPIISGLLNGEKRALSLRWTAYDPVNLQLPFDIDSAHNWQEATDSFAHYGGASLNLVYADVQGHIGYHAIGSIPVRGSMDHPTPLAGVPMKPDAAQEWVGYIPYDKLPQILDPPGGVLATANARITPDDYPYPVTLDWVSPYRNERIWKVLLAGHGFTAADMLKLQNDVHSQLDLVFAQRIAYAFDQQHATAKVNDPQLTQAANILRHWDGRVTVQSSASPIVTAVRNTLWPMLLEPRLGPAWKLYSWGERSYAEEQILTHEPAYWLPKRYANWNEFLVATLARALKDVHAPSDLSTWHNGQAHPIDLEHPVLSGSPLFHWMLGVPVGTGPQATSGDTTTVKQIGHNFGPSERLTVDLSDPDLTTLNLPGGESGSLVSPWYLDQFQAWLAGTTFAFPFTPEATHVTHTLKLEPKS